MRSTRRSVAIELFFRVNPLFCGVEIRRNTGRPELQKQGLRGKELLERLQARDSELRNEVSLHYWLYSPDLDSGKINW
jgi:hypothetical protein